MKINNTLVIALLITISQLSSATEYNVQKLADNNGLEMHNRATETAPEQFPSSVYLTMAQNDGVAWIKGATFSEGTIELEIKGENRPGQSFVGFAFHGQDNNTYDAVYLRPFNFQNADRKDHSLQYISLPKYEWRTLRNAHPGKYESSLSPAPKPTDWVHVKLEIKKSHLGVYINKSDTPELTVDLINERLSGKVGLWVGNGSDGQFRNLKIDSN